MDIKKQRKHLTTWITGESDKLNKRIPQFWRSAVRIELNNAINGKEELNEIIYFAGRFTR